MSSGAASLVSNLDLGMYLEREKLEVDTQF
jgi:hypothetical protein